MVNGHSYKEKKSNNTNLAILSSHNFSEPFNKPIEYGKKVAELVNMLGDGKILAQRYGDILDGKRTWQHELTQSNLKPTLPDVVAGDITSAIPYRTMLNILRTRWGRFINLQGEKDSTSGTLQCLHYIFEEKTFG